MTCLRPCRRIFALLFLLAAATAGAADGMRVLIVDLYVNNERMGDAFVLQDEGGNYYVDETTLHYWEINRPWPEPVRFRDSEYFGVHRFPGTTADMDLKHMALRIFMPASLMPTRRMAMGREEFRPVIEGYGFFMDYDLNWLSQGSVGGDMANGLFRPVIFGPFGNLSANLAYTDGSAAIDRDSLSVLDLTYTRDDPEKMQSLRIGDVVTNPGQQGRPLRIGGIQLATNFGTRPGLITHPLPDFYGQTAVPSALDIYINGRLTRRESVQPGSFVLEDVPVINGLGQMQVVATDALGRQQVFTEDFYLSTDLLAEGLTDYSITLGAVREDFGLANFRYGDFAASATWRHGVRDNLTAEAHGEYSGEVAMAGAAVQYGIDAGGTVSAGLGLSNGPGGAGARWQVGFQRIAAPTHVNVDLSGATRDFSLVGSEQLSPRLQVLVAAGRNFYEYGSLRASVVHQSLFDRESRTIWGLDYSTRILDRLSVAANISYLDSSENDLRLGLRVFMNFGGNHSASGNLSTGRNGTSGNAVFQRNLPMTSGYGYHFGVGKGERGFVDAGVAAQNEYGTYLLDVRQEDGYGTSWQASTRGSVAYMAGVTRLSRQINDAFAVVNVGNIEGVRVYSENIEIGRTDANGQLFVPGLRPYSENQLSIEIDDLPLNARIGGAKQSTAPYSKSGVIVNFDVRVTTNVLLRAVLPDGTPLPEGAIAHVFHTGDNFPIGTGGKLYLQGIDRSSEIAIRWNGTVCDLDVPYPGGSAVIARMGDIVCVPREGQ